MKEINIRESIKSGVSLTMGVTTGTFISVVGVAILNSIKDLSPVMRVISTLGLSVLSGKVSYDVYEYYNDVVDGVYDLIDEKRKV